MTSKLVCRSTLFSTLKRTTPSPPSSSLICTSPLLHQAQPQPQPQPQHVANRQSRHLHRRMPQPRPPNPTPFVPDPATFLKLIGRSLSQHASKIPSWAALFNLTSLQLRDLGIEPARDRRYLLRWRDKFRRGDWGVGGDLRLVDDNGAGLVGIVNVPKTTPSSSLFPLSRLHDGQKEGADSSAAAFPDRASITQSPGTRRVIVNLPPDTVPTPNPPFVAPPSSSDASASSGGSEPTAATASLPPDVQPVAFLKIKGSSQIYGPNVELVKGSGGTMARIAAKEGLWEHKRGHKIDGGERRQAQVRAKQRTAENRAGRS